MDKRADDIVKYPRTEHVEDSRLGPGDDAKGRIKLAALSGRWIVAEEKVDGANSGVSFPGGRLALQSRGHFLDGGARERQFSRFKGWAQCHEEALRAALGERYVMYGEWMQARHTIFYDRLPHLFMEFDVWDKQERCFLSTRARQILLAGAPVVQAPVLHEGFAPSRMKDLKALVGASLCRGADWRGSLAEAAKRAGVDPERALSEADPSDLIEGLYLKVEEGGRTVGRFKWVRSGFAQAIEESGTHWAERPMVLNGLAPGVDLFAPEIGWECPGIFGRDGKGGYKALASQAPERAPGSSAKGAKP